MDDSQTPPAGTQGTVQFVDDANQIHIAWDNDRSFAVLLDAGAGFRLQNDNSSERKFG